MPLGRTTGGPAAGPGTISGKAKRLSIAHILCVDDDIAGLTQLGQQLRQAGYNVTAAASGQAALDLLDAQRFDLMMLDLTMPDMTGLEVLDRVRRGGLRPDELPIIMMAAADEDD